MKIVAINGSPRKNGNTAQVLEVVRREVEAAGVEFQVFQPGAKVHPCMACYHCLNTGSLRCVQTDDMVNDIIAACIEADGILLAAPVYHGGISGNMKCVLDRLMLAAGCGVNQLHHKVGGALCTLRRSGGMETYQQLLSSGAFTLALTELDALYNDASAYLDLWRSGDTRNYALIYMNAYNILMRVAAASTSAEARDAYLKDAEWLLLDTANVIPLYEKEQAYALRGDVTGVVSDGMGAWYFGALWRVEQ